MTYRRRGARGALAAVAALAATIGTLTAAPAAADGTAGERARPGVRAVAPLPPALERVRAAEAEELYGDPGVRPVDQRKTALISLGDSEISGEGIGTYEPGTDGPDNWCHRSPQAAIHRTTIPADLTYNVACSGATTENVRIGGTPQYPDELVQSDNLAIKARNTKISTVLLVIGANDDLEFAPVLTDCVTRWFTLQGACHPKYAPTWQDRIDRLRPKVERTLRDLRTVMSQAGYADGDYDLVVMGYPSPIGPDFEDNPDFPGKLPGGCVGHTEDAAWGRNGAVPPFASGIRQAARATGATFLDNSRLFHGHEVCMEETWVRGLTVDLSHPFPPNANSVRQSFHPNARGHAAFASCLSQLHRTGWREAGCADPAGTGAAPQLRAGAWDDAFGPLTGAGTGSCVDARGGSSRNGTAVGGWPCGGQRGQGWWHDTTGTGSVYSALTHDRCLDVPGGRYVAGAELVLWNCSGVPHQRFSRQADTLRPAAATGLCLTLAAPRDPLRLQPCDGSAAQRFR